MYRIQETPEEEEARLKKWETFLNANKENSNQISNNENTTADTNENDAESDETRSSAGSGDETDEEQERK